MVSKVKFELNPYPRELITFSNFLRRAGVMSRYIFKCYPHVKEYVDFKLDKKKFREKVAKFVFSFRKKHSKEFIEKIGQYQSEWDKIGVEYLNVLAKVLECKWPRNKIVYGRISINPVCPRFLEDWSFNIYFRKSLNGILETTAHEICHFVYFKKWLKVFPDADKKSFEFPYLEWQLSEILVGIILNDKRIKDVLKVDATSYKWYYISKIGKLSIYNYFNTLYQKHLLEETSFEEFLQLVYTRAKRYKNEIMNAENDFKV